MTIEHPTIVYFGGLTSLSAFTKNKSDPHCLAITELVSGTLETFNLFVSKNSLDIDAKVLELKMKYGILIALVEAGIKTITFDMVSERCSIGIADVELFIAQCMDVNVITGKMNQESRTVAIKYSH